MVKNKREIEAFAKLLEHFDQLSEFDRGVLVGKAETLEQIAKGGSINDGDKHRPSGSGNT